MRRCHNVRLIIDSAFAHTLFFIILLLCFFSIAVLHPIFEEDELTLVLAVEGAVLGFADGLVQQGLETGAIQIDSPKRILGWMRRCLHNPKQELGNVGRSTRKNLTNHGLGYCRANEKAGCANI